MLGGRNIRGWYVASNEYMLVPHSKQHKYGIPETELLEKHLMTYNWLEFYQKNYLIVEYKTANSLTRKTPFYRLDNVGEYTYAPYKVLWKSKRAVCLR